MGFSSVLARLDSFLSLENASYRIYHTWKMGGG